MKKTLVLLLAVVACSLWMHSVTVGQTAFQASINATDGTDNATLTLGVNGSATFGKDAGMGETELPPAGVSGVFDVRFKSPRGDTAGFGEGRLVDVRSLASDCQLDTFKLVFQAGSGSTVTLSWSALPSYCAPTRWRLVSSLGASPDVDVDMSEVLQVDIDNELYSSVYILKGDGHEFRTFELDDLALDGLTDAKGKITYAKSVKAANNQAEFVATFTNSTGAAVNGLYVAWGEAVDSASLEVSNFTTWTLVKAGKYDKWNFTGATIANGATVTIHGWGQGKKAQTCAWNWTNAGVLTGAKEKTGTFTSNILRWPMPNTVNVG